MRKNLLLLFIALSFSTFAYGQGTPKPTPTPAPKPPVYIAADNVTTVAQVTDVTSKDEYYIHLKALIESHKVKNLTYQYEYNGAANLNSPDLGYMASNGQIAMMAVAKERGMLASKYKALFGKSCSTPLGKNGVLAEAEVLEELKCRFGLTEMKNSTPTNVVTKGRFAMLLNQALNLWIRKLDALK
ncbi:MAG: hypothetical protein WBO68_08005 [Pyrinomonadaceae bacterium]|nr:hypothetical protein [Acidobacteriota bacterium]